MSSAHPLLPADVYNRFGGKAALTQLIDPNGQGTWSEETLDTAMLDAWLWVLSFVQVQAQIVGLTNDQLREAYPDYISLAARKTVPNLWLAGASGQAMPEAIKELNGELNAQLEALAERRRKHGGQNTDPSAAQRVARIALADGRMTLGAFKGFI